MTCAGVCWYPYHRSQNICKKVYKNQKNHHAHEHLPWHLQMIVQHRHADEKGSETKVKNMLPYLLSKMIYIICISHFCIVYCTFPLLVLELYQHTTIQQKQYDINSAETT